MAFANLFTTLCAVGEDAKSSESTFPPSRTLGEDVTGKRRCGRKRKIRDDQNISYKSRFCQDQTSRTSNVTGSLKHKGSNTIDDCMQKNDSEHASFSFSQNLVYKQSRESDQKNIQNINTKNKTNMKKQEQKKNKTEEDENHHWQKNAGRPASKRGWHTNKPASRKGGGSKQCKFVKQDVPVERKRFMTQEFMDQNALLVDGRVLCRHFLWGKCIKGDKCQLEHIQGHNDLIKEVCKFYIQGFCTKGESCPYMHNSFPCKFFHARRNCSQGADCRFSHEPLTELTKRLLDEALKRDSDLSELANKAKHEASGQPANTDESVNIEVSSIPDKQTQSIRPNFYNSADPHAQEENLCQTEEKSDITEVIVPSHATDAAVSHNPSANLNHTEPVCYSVEALLGPQISKPFFSFYTAAKSNEHAPPSVPQTTNDCSSDSANQSEVPYSIDAVLRSHKAVEKSSLSYPPTLSTAQTVSYNLNTVSKEVTNPPMNSENQKDKASYSVNVINESNTFQGKTLNSLSCPQMHTSQISTLSPLTKTCSDPPLTSGVCKEEDDTSESQKPQSGSVLYPLVSESKNIRFSKTKIDIKIGPASSTYSPQNLTQVNGSQSCDINGFQVSAEPPKQRDTVFGSGDCKNDDLSSLRPIKPTQRAFHSLFSKLPGETSNPQHPIQIKPHFPCPSPGSQSSGHSHCPSLGSVKSKGRVEIQHPQRTLSGLRAEVQQYDGTETTAECKSRETHAESAVGFTKTTKRAFHSLFAKPITDGLQLKPDPATSTSCPQSFIKTSSLPSLCSAEWKREDIPEAESDEATSKSFLSLFAVPLSETLSCKESQPKSARTSCYLQVSASPRSCSSDSKKRASNLETPCQSLFSDFVRTNAKETFHSSATRDRHKKENEEGSNTAEQKVTTEQLVNPACSFKSDSVSEISASHKDVKRLEPTTNQQPNTSSVKGSSLASTANSVLKTLFLSLSPYIPQDNVQVSVPSVQREKAMTSSRLRGK